MDTLNKKKKLMRQIRAESQKKEKEKATSRKSSEKL